MYTTVLFHLKYFTMLTVYMVKVMSSDIMMVVMAVHLDKTDPMLA